LPSEDVERRDEMPLTEVDAKAALIVIDLQKGIVGMPLAQAAEEIVERSARLAKAFRAKGWPVVLVNVTAAAPGRTDAGRFVHAFPEGWEELVPELEAQAGDILISKKRVGAFLGTTLDEQLKAAGVTQVFLTGIATSGGVESTGRSARDLDYNVVFVVDAMTDRDAEAQRHCVEKVFPRFGETETTERVLQRLTE
jgi:nicotinamidase-related amidase